MRQVFIILALTASELGLPDKSVQTSTVSTVLKLVWTICGAISVIFVIIGGLKYTLSNGDPNQVSSAKDTILYAIVGLVISLVAFGITTFVLGKVG